MSDEFIRGWRDKIISRAENDEACKIIMTYSDFYTLSNCRDLLFHPQEVHYSLQEIEGLLSDVGLDFHSMEISSEAVRGAFTNFCEETGRQSSLSTWALFEERYPDTFAGMYNFWCRKGMNVQQ